MEIFKEKIEKKSNYLSSFIFFPLDGVIEEPFLIRHVQMTAF